MTLAERLSEFVRAAFTGLWIQSFEHDDAIAEIARLCRQQSWTLAAWDIDRGLNLHGRGSDSGTAVSASDPLSAIRSLGTMANPDGTSILVLRNFHKFLTNIEVVQALDSAIAAGKTARTFVVVLSPVVQIPVELERALRRHRARPARPRPARADRPRRRHRARRAARGRRPDRRARRGGRADPRRGRERLLAQPGPAQPSRPGRPLGAQGARR